MVDLSSRADPRLLPEQMDGEVSYEDFRACVRDIVKVTGATRGSPPTFAWLHRAAARWSARGRRGPMRIVDVGCGYGDMLRQIERWASARGLDVELTGVDLNPHAARAAAEATPPGSCIRWVNGNAYALTGEIDIVISALVTHHMTDNEIVTFLSWMEGRASLGWFISDLHRKPVPYYLFGALLRVWPLHRFNRHDGLVSFRRSFLREDWMRLCAAAGLPADTVQITEHVPARLCVGRLR